ncbi:nuclease-related domain-containing protein [Ureibacillus aquaedulcis]|uniref:Nuclease-related domain-containing protein n=1 Tax=Ureibacillus aquaedulcis TaxID=3058421 RepID=A0ABT8GL04_9BACL|nr:nuclease-related domain-containing protein [Ureibacillus sp. BA0131]MDN4492049.1 nuclease-related domain-containing protein [Ureibacillus sp. BA0131]
MEILKRQKSWKLLGLEALLRRLPDYDTGEFNFYKDMYTAQKKGYEGELSVDQMWIELNIPTPYALLHNFETINHAGYTHQIDTILLTPHFIWLLEIKNIGGRLDIDESKHQLIRTNSEGMVESFRNPVNQIKRHGKFISRKLRDLRMNLPVEYSIIIVSDYTIIGSIPKSISIFHANGLQTELDKLFNKHQGRGISLGQFEKIKTELLNIQQPKEWKAKVETKRLQKGVLCKKCDYKSVMIFEHGSFRCGKCGFKSKDAHLEALLDYRYLWSEWITNRELRDFLGVDSRFSIIRLLKDLNIEYQGTYRDRKYRIPESFE